METVRLDRDVFQTIAPNGVRILSERVPTVRSVAAGIWVRSASVHESRDEMGVSHLLEHMVFKGTERRTASEIATAIEGLGGTLDAYTTREHTSYQARVLDEHVPEALDVLADLVLAPRLDEADLELEREVVLEEIAEVEDTPDDLVFELHARSLWGAHAFGRSILGTPESVSSMRAERLREIHAERYLGENLVVAAAGNVHHDDLVERVQALFGRVERGARTPPVERPDGTRSGVERVSRETAQTHVVFGTDVPGHAHPDRYAFVLLSSALGSGMSSRLFQRVREELALCYTIYTYQSFYTPCGISGVYVGTRPATAEQAAAAVRDELARVASDGIPELELERVKRQVKGQVMLSLESTGARLHRLASFALHDEPMLDLGGLLAKIDAVTPDDVARIAARWFTPERQLELRLGPG
ncbi:MAG TPA: pitrilysin family protein [Longimicrobiales bacterium]|nr:pitrilysin family protein [Longimicrobiales bacterium]